jgi:1,4-alpha-glucan branching enzyme
LGQEEPRTLEAKVIKRSKLFGNKTRVTFCLPKDAPDGAVSVVGTFNDWEPGLHELKDRRDGTRTVTVRLDPGHYRFRYLASDGVWLDDEHADVVGPQGSELLL